MRDWVPSRHFIWLCVFACAIPWGASASDLVTRSYQLKFVDANDIIPILNFSVANPTGKRILAGHEKHLVVTDAMEQQEAIAELLPVMDQPSKETDPKRAQMMIVVRTSRYLQQKKKAPQGNPC